MISLSRKLFGIFTCHFSTACSIALLAIASQSALGETLTTLLLNPNQAVVTTKIIGPQGSALTSDNFYDTFRAALEKSHLFSLVQDVPNGKPTETIDPISGIKTVAQSRFLFLGLNASERIPGFLTKVDEIKIVCPTGLPTGVTCLAMSTVNVTGPLAVYGNFSERADIGQLLGNKQTLGWNYIKIDANSTQIMGTFTVTSLDFEASVFKLLDTYLGADGMRKLTSFDSRIGGGTVSPLTQNRILISIGRFVRMINEGMVP